MSAAASRRGFLKGFAAFSAGGVASGAVVAMEQPASPDAELLRLGAELAQAAVVYDAAAATVVRCKAAWEEARPDIPAALIMPAWDGLVQTEWPPSFEGRPCPKCVRNRIRIPCRYDLDRLVKIADGRTVKGRFLRRLKRFSDEYHEADQAARQAVRQSEICTDAWHKGRAVIALGHKVAAINAVTLQGLAVKGRAGIAMHRVWADDGGLRIENSYRLLLLNLASLDGREVPALCA